MKFIYNITRDTNKFIIGIIGNTRVIAYPSHRYCFVDINCSKSNLQVNSAKARFNRMQMWQYSIVRGIYIYIICSSKR